MTTVLTDTEEQVIKSIAAGNQLKDLAYATHRSYKTIDSHKTSAMKKLGLHNRAELVQFCIATGRVQLIFDSSGKRVR